MTACKSRYSTLIVSGCSFTANNHESSCCWANVLAERTGMNIVNLAVDAAGNKHIADSLILYLTKHSPDPATVLIMPMWSSIARTDFITASACHSIEPQPVKPFYYDANNQLYSICENSETNYHGAWARTYKSRQNDSSLSLQSWLEINKLTNYLCCNHYDYRYLAFNDILYGNGISPLNFVNELKNIDLELDLSKWLLTGTKEPLGEFALYHNLLCSDGIHPSLQGHEQWLEQKLMPALIEHNILQ